MGNLGIGLLVRPLQTVTLVFSLPPLISLSQDDFGYRSWSCRARQLRGVPRNTDTPHTSSTMPCTMHILLIPERSICYVWAAPSTSHFTAHSSHSGFGSDVGSDPDSNSDAESESESGFRSDSGSGFDCDFGFDSGFGFGFASAYALTVFPSFVPSRILEILPQTSLGLCAASTGVHTPVFL